MMHANNSTPPNEIENLEAQTLAVTVAQNSPLASRFIPGPQVGLPEGWWVEERPRRSLKYIGKVDQFFFEPWTNRQFRSLKSVEKHLGIQVKGNKRKSEAAQLADLFKASFSQISNSGPSNVPKKKKRKVSFDFANPPEKVTWALTAAEHNDWCPFINATMVPETEKYGWTITQVSINDASSYKASASNETKVS